jgi:hypothetical protein
MTLDLVQRGEQLVELMDAEEHMFLAMRAGDGGQVFCASGEAVSACAALGFPHYHYVSDSPDVQGWGSI